MPAPTQQLAGVPDAVSAVAAAVAAAAAVTAVAVLHTCNATATAAAVAAQTLKDACYSLRVLTEMGLSSVQNSLVL